MDEKNIKTLKFSTIILIIPTLLSFIYVADISSVFTALERRIGYLVAPILILFLSKDESERSLNFSLRGIFYGVCAASIFLISKNLYKYYTIRPLFYIDKDILNYYHTGKEFTKIVDIHPTYFGMYVLLAFLILLFKSPIRKPLVRVIVFLVLFVCTLFLNARIIFFMFMVIVLFFFWKNITKFFNTTAIKVAVVLGSCIILGIAFVAFFGKTYFYQRMTSELNWELSYEVGTNYNKKGTGDSRVARWHAALALIGEQPLLGYGAGGEVDVLSAKFEEMGMAHSVGYRYNAHNQFLGFALEGGIFAVFLLGWFFLGNLNYAIKTDQIIHLWFFLTLFVICFFENYLIRNAGITFVAFFSTLLNANRDE
ncbi:O-antigen ligase family protein [Arenibacter sp. GZD96]|uniref:O-antigen ligase family protein n=1 Tax=Aurantibrevibacter litoralis TaxID=3106030 RepID=UPI002AFE4491|nr:O-antigen ligase family protein [Arenibacter sp. GZD-96]MEA1786444.1 O-antigen ligase family protein [Arenibacter sp. GZD-96]